MGSGDTMKIVPNSVEFITELNEKAMLQQIERAARNCYRTEGSITEDGESAKRIVKMLISKGHDAMLEFADITVRLTCGLATYKDLTRHRHCSFAIESTRYVDYNKKGELTFIEPWYDVEENDGIYHTWLTVMKDIENSYKLMKELRASNDMVRGILPQDTAASVFMKANVREWRYVLKLRTSKTVNPEVRKVMNMVLAEFKDKLPTLFGDINNEEN